jgi:hypothetical protein
MFYGDLDGIIIPDDDGIFCWMLQGADLVSLYDELFCHPSKESLVAARFAPRGIHSDSLDFIHSLFKIQ